MSYESMFGLSVVIQRNVLNHFGNEIGEWISGKNAEANPSYEHSKHWDMMMLASTRSDWFKRSMAQLVRLAGCDELQFMIEEFIDQSAQSGEKFASADYKKYLRVRETDSDGKYGHQTEYSLILNPNKAASGIGRLVNWIRTNPALAGPVILLEPDEVEDVFDQSYFTLNPSEKSKDDEGQGPHFFFCTVKTIKDLLRYAEARNLLAVYESDQMVPYGKAI